MLRNKISRWFFWILSAGRHNIMIRSFLAVAVTVLVVSIWACGGSSEEHASSSQVTVTPIPTSRLFPTIAAIPTNLPAARYPVDPNVGYGPPLSERHCKETYRPPPASCHVSHMWTLRPSGMWGLGEPPVWIVSGAPVGGELEAERRPTPEIGTKTIWIVDDGVEGEVKLTGRRLDGPEVAVFPVYQRDHTFELNAAGERERDWDRTELVLVPPHGRLKAHRTEIYIPSPGCWQFTARTETETVQIVQYLYPLE